MRKVDDGGGKNGKRIMFIMATNVVASRPTTRAKKMIMEIVTTNVVADNHLPTGTPTACAKITF